jgi:hypothetical protein
MSKPSAARHRMTNWPEHNAALRRRGLLLAWVDREMEWSAPEARTTGPA